MPVPFKQAQRQSTKPDVVGTVRVKVILQHPDLQPGFPVPGNLKWEVELEATTVGAVKAVIENALFGGGSAAANPTAD